VPNHGTALAKNRKTRAHAEKKEKTEKTKDKKWLGFR